MPTIGTLYIGNAEQSVLHAFSKLNVRYLIIGGRAVQFYGHLRSTKDLDIFIDRSGDNPSRIWSALISINCAGSTLSADELSKCKKQIRLNDYCIELLTSPEGPSFEEAYANRAVTSQMGFPVSVVAREDLLGQKRKAGRPIDLADIKALEEL